MMKKLDGAFLDCRIDSKCICMKLGNVFVSNCEMYKTAAAPWKAPFKIAELIVHKKFMLKGRNSKVGQNSNINIQI